MAQVIKAFAVNTAVSSTVYTVPTARIAKVVISSLHVSCTGDNSPSDDSMTLNVGLVGITAGVNSTNTTTSTITYGPAKSQFVSTTTTTSTVDASPPLVFYLIAGQTIATVKVNNGTCAVKAQICVTEVPT